jgi:hypothetical protein
MLKYNIPMTYITKGVLKIIFYLSGIKIKDLTFDDD